MASSELSTPRTTSTSGMTTAGLKKCMPTTEPGRPVAAPIRVIGIDDVFEARIASGASTITSSAAKSSFLRPSFSTIASMTS